jgi:hypothetical protein
MNETLTKFRNAVSDDLKRGESRRSVPGTELLDAKVNIPTKNSNRV